ncbi:MAG: 2'-5' RNA ligase family protein [Mycobacterium sp.]
MAHSIELLFDDDTDAALRQVWDALADAGVPSQNRVASPTNRPHVTVVVADRLAPAVDTDLRALADRLPLPCLLGAPLVFGRGRLTLAHLVVPSAELLAFHRRVYDVCVPHLTPGPAPHSEPGSWTAHATLGRRLTPAQLGTAFAAVPALTGERRASFTGLRRWDGDERVEHVLIG